MTRSFTVEALVEIALAAGLAILRFQPKSADVTVKSDGSPVTSADLCADALIAERLGAVAPTVPIVSEEAARVENGGPGSERFFLVDPLDGTKEFLRGSGEFTVNIALIEHGVPVLGVVHAPALGEVYTGDANAGARRGVVVEGQVRYWEAIQVAKPDGGVRVVASRSHVNGETLAFIGRYHVREHISAGSSLKFCRVAEGKADLYPRLGRTMEWDTAAGDAVLRAAGGCVRTFDCKPLLYGKRGMSGEADFANPWFVASGPFNPFADPNPESWPQGDAPCQEVGISNMAQVR